jgi:hypothetical protein
MQQMHVQLPPKQPHYFEVPIKIFRGASEDALSHSVILQKRQFANGVDQTVS